MSAIKNFLETQKADFISLHDLLEAMTKHGNGCTLAEAAAVLAQIIKQGKDNATVCHWVSYTPAQGLRRLAPPSQNKQLRPDELLAWVVRFGEFEDDIPF